MKRIKKMIGIMLTIAMTIAMTATAFAVTPKEPVSNYPTEGANKGEKGYYIFINKPIGVDSENDLANYNYKAYQIFKGSLDPDGKLGNIEWGSGVKLTDGKVAFAEDSSYAGKDAKTIAESFLAGKDFDSKEAQDFATAISSQLAETATGTSEVQRGSDNKISGYKISGLEVGYYLVMSGEFQAGAENSAATRYMMEVVGNVTATPKSDVPTSEKKIISGNGTLVDENTASIGDTITYQVTGTMPSNIADYNTYTYIFEDTLSKGLSLKDSEFGDNKIEAVISVNGIDVSTYFYRTATKAKDADGNETGETNITIGIQDLKALTLLENKVGEITADTKVVVTYKAKLNNEAIIAGAGNPNTVKLQYSNDPNQSGTGATTPPPGDPEKPNPPKGVTPESKVVTYTTKLTILKTDGADGKLLPGTKFTLTGKGVSEILVSTKTEFVVDADGEYWKLKTDPATYTKEKPIEEGDKANIDKYVNDGNMYKMVTTLETKSSANNNEDNERVIEGIIDDNGYVTFHGLGIGDYVLSESYALPGYNTLDDIEFTISWTKEGGFVSSDSALSIEADNTLFGNIKNNKGSLLPSTGGIGTTIFYIIGGILVVGAAILLVTKKRMSKEA